MKVVRVGDVAEQVRGVSYSKDDAFDSPKAGAVALLRANNIADEGLNFDGLIWVGASNVSLKQYLQRGDIVIAASSGSISVVGKAAQLDADFAGTFGAFCKVLRPSPEVHDRYLGHFLRTPAYRRLISSLAAGANINNLKNEHLDNLEIPLPPLDEQRRIAAILDQADELRRKRREAITILRSAKQSLLNRLLSGIESSDRRDCALSELIRDDDSINYGVVQPGGDLDKGANLIRVANVVSNDFRYTSLKKIAPEIEAQYRRSRLRGDEILIACVGSVGALAIPPAAMKGSNIARAVARIPADPRKIDRAYLAEFLLSDICQNYFKSEIRAVAQPTLNIKQLNETRIIVPPPEAQRGIADKCAQIDAVADQQTASLKMLDALFSSLQHRAFSGEL